MKRAAADVPDAHVWVCEFCRRAAVGKDPPDTCLTCGHAYFDNFSDIVREAGGVSETREYQS